jgi:hypothetical protein
MKGELDALWCEGALAEEQRAELVEWVAAERRVGIVVRQLWPGARHRIPIRLTTNDPLDSYTDAGIPTVEGLRAWSDATLAEHPDEASMREVVEARIKRRIDSVQPLFGKPGRKP